MRALLDTHAFIWAISQPDRLGDRARAIISDRSNDLLVSAASAWELAVKFRLGNLPGAGALIDEHSGHLTHLDAAALDVDSEAALLARSLRWEHRDPFDRMLAAQTLGHDLVLLTVDPVFQTLPSLRTRW